MMTHCRRWAATCNFLHESVEMLFRASQALSGRIFIRMMGGLGPWRQRQNLSMHHRLLKGLRGHWLALLGMMSGSKSWKRPLQSSTHSLNVSSFSQVSALPLTLAAVNCRWDNFMGIHVVHSIVASFPFFVLGLWICFPNFLSPSICSPAFFSYLKLPPAH